MTMERHPTREQPRGSPKPLVRMCSSRSHFPNFADIGDTVVLFVDFGNNLMPVPKRNLAQSIGGATVGQHPPIQPNQYEIKLAGLQSFLKKLKPKDQVCTSFRAEARVLFTDEVLQNPGGLVKFVVPYSSKDGEYLGAVTEQDLEYDTTHRVYHYLLWNELIEHNQFIRTELQHRANSILIDTTYGAIGHQRHSLRQTAGPSDQVDAALASASAEAITSTTDERVRLVQNQRHPPRRYWPESWEMKCWRHCCDPLLRSTNCFTRFWAMFFVAPLTNVTCLSLYYQLYLTEIFHQKFWTRFGHYTCMPLIVMMMMTFFAQFRFDDQCYTLKNTEVFIFNGAAVMACVLFVWYAIWGLLQKTRFMWFFMILPLLVLYILANITFQVAVKSSNNFICNECWNHTKLHPHVWYFNAFELIHWYLNPVPWAIFLCFLQAISHSFEPKLPPRVSQTAHWMSCSDMLKAYGCYKTIVIFLAQAIFGTVDELLASARLLPLLILRVCFTLGYSPKQWEVLQILVEKSLQYGDPALDYIGTGGAEYLPEDSVIPSTSLTESDFNISSTSLKDADIGYNIATLKRHLKEMEDTLTPEHHEKLKDPRKLTRGLDDWLEHYIVVRHYVAKYQLQVHAYGPFRTNQQNVEAECDNRRMERDFPMKEHRSFRSFLNEVRFYLWMMEDEMIERRARSLCCQNEV